MIGEHEYKQAGVFPHMGPEDTKVWQRFITAFPEAYDTVSYDIKIGPVPSFVTRDEQNIGGNISNLYRRKIDVVGFKGNNVDIIEVKPTAGMSTVGQILGYLMHWQNEIGENIKANPVIVCSEAALDVHMLAERNGVKIIEV